MKTVEYKIEVKNVDTHCSVPLGNISATKVFDFYSVFKNRFPENEGFSVEVFEREIIEKKLITENWKI